MANVITSNLCQKEIPNKLMSYNFLNVIVPSPFILLDLTNHFNMNQVDLNKDVQIIFAVMVSMLKKR